MQCQISLIVLTSVFIIVTILHDFDKAFYQQYKKFFNKFRNFEIEQKSSKDDPLMKKGKAVEKTGQRSQSFALWLQFQDIQKKKVKTANEAEMVGEKYRTADTIFVALFILIIVFI